MVISGGKARITKAGSHTEVLKQGDSVVPSNVVGSFFNELVSPLTGQGTKKEKLIQKVVGGKGEVSDAGTVAANVVKGFSPVGLDEAGDAIRSGLRGDVGGFASNAIRAAPFGGMAMDLIDRVKPAPTPEPEPAPTPQRRAAPQSGGQSKPPSGSTAGAPPTRKEKRADAGDMDSINMLKTMFAA
jgi:hypothetical protein